MLNRNWNYPTSIWFGVGRINDLAKACQQLGMKNPLFVTDEGLVSNSITEQALSVLKKNAIPHTVYSNVQGNPTGDNVEKGVLHYKKHQHDGVIAFGGGSAIDAAKTIAFMSGQTKSVWDFEDVGDNWLAADVNGIAPIVAVPTTSGTGSEVGRASVILDEANHTKKLIFHPKMLPGLVISDPELTVGLPPHITAWTGVDAMVHAIEAYCAPGYHPMADGIAIEAIKLIAENLPKAFKNGKDIEARGHMLVAASMGATAFQKGLGSVHSVAHQLGAIYNKQHGLLNAIILPYALKQNADAIEERMQYLSMVLGLPSSGTEAVIQYILDLKKALNIPHSLAEIDITDANAETIGTMAFKDPSTPTNAKPVTNKDLENLFRAAVNGDFSLVA